MNTTPEEQAVPYAHSPSASIGAEPQVQPDSQKSTHELNQKSSRLGSWAYKHHDFLNSKFARIALRNIGSCVIGILALVPVFVADKKILNTFANNHTTGFDENGNRTYSGNAVTRTMAATAASDNFKQVTAVGLSFSSYRLINKTCKTMFDMLAEKHESEEAAVETAHKMKGTFTKYVGKFAKFEFMATIPAAVWLVLTQAPFGQGPNGFNAQNTKKSWLKASAIAGLISYPGFFSITNGLFKKATGHSGAMEEIVAQAQKGDTPEFVAQEQFVKDTGLGAHPVAQRLSHTIKPEEPAPTLIDKGLGFAKFTTAIATGIVGYYYAKRGLSFKVGLMNLETPKPDGTRKPGESVLKSLYKEGVGYESFFIFTAIEEMMNMALDKPFKALAGFLNKKVYGDKIAPPPPTLIAAAPQTTAQMMGDPLDVITAPSESQPQFSTREKAGAARDLVAAGPRPMGQSSPDSLQPMPG